MTGERVFLLIFEEVQIERVETIGPQEISMEQRRKEEGERGTHSIPCRDSGI